MACEETETAGERSDEAEHRGVQRYVAGEVVELSWQAKAGGKKLAGGKLDLTIPLVGSSRSDRLHHADQGRSPASAQVAKSGKTLFEENRIVFEVD